MNLNELEQKINFEEYIDFVGEQESQEIRPAGYFEEKVIERIRLGDRIVGDLLPFQKTHDKFACRTGELVLWAGYNGMKKSLVLGYVFMHFALVDRVALASMEMPPAVTLHRMSMQAGGCFVSEEYYRKFSAWANPRLMIYDQLDSVKMERILGFVHYAAVKLGCKHVAIDSLTKCGLGKEDYEGEKVFLDRLQWAAKTLDVCIHVVCHCKKPEGDRHPRLPNRYSIRGASEISDLADTVIILHSNTRKKDVQNKEENGKQLSADEIAVLDQPDQWLRIDKQRNGTFEGTFALWHKNHQFHDHDTNARRIFEIG